MFVVQQKKWCLFIAFKCLSHVILNAHTYTKKAERHNFWRRMVWKPIKVIKWLKRTVNNAKGIVADHQHIVVLGFRLARVFLYVDLERMLLFILQHPRLTTASYVDCSCNGIPWLSVFFCLFACRHFFRFVLFCLANCNPNNCHYFIVNELELDSHCCGGRSSKRTIRFPDIYFLNTH